MEEELDFGEGFDCSPTEAGPSALPQSDAGAGNVNENFITDAQGQSLSASSDSINPREYIILYLMHRSRLV